MSLSQGNTAVARTHSPSKISSPASINPIDEPSVSPNNVPNVLIFGETGVGKSALINMLAGEEIAQSNSKASGCTFESKSYTIVIDGKEYRVWDTAGLNEAEGGTVDPAVAITRLADLVTKLHHRLNLLVYCIRGTRIRKIVKLNYDLIEAIGNERVPIVLVITGLEQENDMEDWWKGNEELLLQEGIRVGGHACVTTTLGKKKDGVWIYQSEYDMSRHLVKELVMEHCLKQAYVLQRAPDVQHLDQEQSSESHRTGDRETTSREGPQFPLAFVFKIYKLLCDFWGISQPATRSEPLPSKSLAQARVGFLSHRKVAQGNNLAGDLGTGKPSRGDVCIPMRS